MTCVMKPFSLEISPVSASFFVVMCTDGQPLEGCHHHVRVLIGFRYANYINISKFGSRNEELLLDKLISGT